MNADDEAQNKSEEAQGSAKDEAGETTGNEQRQDEGHAEQASGLQQAKEKLKDAVSGIRKKN